MAALAHNMESTATTVVYVVELYDGVTGANALQGTVKVQVTGREIAYPKTNVSQFVFFTLAPGAYTVSVASDPSTPYYVPVNIPVTVPAPGSLWPAFPDRSLADLTKLLDDPTQPAAYVAQRTQATLMPTTKYPFTAGASLARGTVSTAGLPLAGATVSCVGLPQQYLTAADGQYVLFFNSVTGMGQAATIQSVCAPHPALSMAVTLFRGLTISQDLAMA